MVRSIPHAVLLACSTGAFVLWHYNVYPFSDPLFSFEGYAIHFFGGVLYTTGQVSVMQVLWLIWKRFHASYEAHGIIAFYALLVIELLQFFDSSRTVQWQDVLAQTAGIVLAIAILWFFSRRSNTL